MTVGIVSYGAYIPMYRLSFETIAEMWGGHSGPGEKAVANWDEDSLTMASEAIIDCLNGIDRNSVGGLYLATTTPAYQEKQTASILASVVGIPRHADTVDITDSIRGGTIAMRLALDGVSSASNRRCLVAASDCRLPAPDSAFERTLGDGAAAFLMGDSELAVTIEGSLSLSSSFMDTWKRPADIYMQQWEDRFVLEEGYVAHVKELVMCLFSKYGVSATDFKKIVLFAYDRRRYRDLAKALGFAPEQVQNALLDAVGNTGTASVPMMIVAALEESKPGDRILVVNYGDGADALMLRVEEGIEKIRNRRGIKQNLASKMTLPSYGKYVHFRNLMEWEDQFMAPPYTSLSVSWRDREWILGMKGAKCDNCGNIIFPPQRVCSYCQSKDSFEPVNMADKKCRLFSYSLDNLKASVDPPTVVSIVDFEGGGRFSTIMTDRDPKKLALDMPVELTFRKFHESKRVKNYFWKCRPVRGGDKA